MQSNSDYLNVYASIKLMHPFRIIEDLSTRKILTDSLRTIPDCVNIYYFDV